MNGEYKTYEECFKAARFKACLYQAEQGLEQNKLFGYWRFFRLPPERYRTGHERLCQVVRIDHIKPEGLTFDEWRAKLQRILGWDGVI